MAPSAIESYPDSQLDFVDTDELRTKFALAMSAMYKNEVPLYGTLIRIVRDVNDETLANSTDPKFLSLRNGDVASERLDLERHGAIRLGTPYELQTVRRIFAIIGLEPVGYYDLSPAGLPMHATCFRPTTTASLKRNPFRVFTTLLRPELLSDPSSSRLALELLARRNIFSPELIQLLETAEGQNMRLTSSQGHEFVSEAMKTFGWRPTAAATKPEYQRLKDEHPILADIACFQSAHINHLTPRTLDICAAQERMKAGGLNVKQRIEGPPPRKCPILLRQTSFLALEESIMFRNTEGLAEGSHKARFGEIEERGAAVTAKGRELYDELLGEAMEKIAGETSLERQDLIMASTFGRYPDSWEELRRKDLVYFTFRCGSNANLETIPPSYTRESLLESKILEAVPMTYEDFLPLSAAGIFQSNLQSGQSKAPASKPAKASPDVGSYEEALGRSVINLDQSYADAQTESLERCAAELGLEIGALL